MAEFKYEGHDPIDVISFHFADCFCSERCGRRYIYGEEDDEEWEVDEDTGDPVPNLSRLKEMFELQASHRTRDVACRQCDDRLSVDDQSGWGGDLSEDQQYRYGKRLVAAIEERVGGDAFLRGYTVKWDRQKTGVGIYMPKPGDIRKIKKGQGTIDMKLNDLKRMAGSDAEEIARRVKASQMNKTLAAGLARVVAQGDSEMAEKLAAFLTTNTLGQALVGAMAGTGAMLLPENMRSAEFDAFMREIRVGPVAKAADELADLVTNPVRELAMSFLPDPKAIKAVAAPTETPKIEEPKVRRRRRKTDAPQAAADERIEVKAEPKTAPKTNGHAVS